LPYLQLPPRSAVENNPTSLQLPTGSLPGALPAGFLEGEAWDLRGSTTRQQRGYWRKARSRTRSSQRFLPGASRANEINKNTSVKCASGHARDEPADSVRRISNPHFLRACRRPADAVAAYVSASEVPEQLLLRQHRGRRSMTSTHPLARTALDRCSQRSAVAQSIYHAGSVDLTHRFTKGLYSGRTTPLRRHRHGTNELFTSRVNPRRAEDG